MNNALVPDGYHELLTYLKHQISAARVRAALAVNRELIELYWRMGREIDTRVVKNGWGAKTIDRLSRDLRSSFPDMRGFSLRNLRYMRSFAAAWPDETILQQAIAKIPWGHNITLLERINDRETRLWYAAQTIENGWSRNVLELHIANRLHERQGKAISNFSGTLPEPQSDLAVELVKSDYNFDFLCIGTEAREREIEQGLVDHVRRFLVELGTGFAFVGSQYHLKVGNTDFYIDLLFYHLTLHCYVVIELKAGPFKPEHAGKLNFYLTAVDRQLRDPDRQEPTIGIILCRTRDKIVAEYALQDSKKPLGIATYITEELPKLLAENLPSTDELEAELTSDDETPSDSN